MKEYDWDELKEKCSILYYGMGTSRAIYTMMMKIEELEHDLNYRINTVHEKINRIYEGK